VHSRESQSPFQSSGCCEVPWVCLTLPKDLGAFPGCTAGFQDLSPDWPGVMSQKLLYKIQTTTPPMLPHQRAARALPQRQRLRGVCAAWGEENLAIPSASPLLSKIPPLLWRGWEGQGEGEYEMAHEDKQGMHPSNRPANLAVYSHSKSFGGGSCCRSAALKHECRDHHREIKTGIPSAPELVVGMNDGIIDFAPNANRQTG